MDAVQVERQQKRLGRFLAGTENPAGVRAALQHAMWEGAGIFRNADGLTRALAAADALAGKPLRAATPRNLAACCIVQNMCLTASLICRSALLREESRGAHVRRDVTQGWDAGTSPFNHTFISDARQGIERKGGAA